MKSFQAGLIESQPVSMELLSTIRQIGEYKGKQDLYRQQAPAVLETLMQIAVIQSAESSNRIEGVSVAPERLSALMAEKSVPRNRSEAEIAGYRDVLSIIHVSHADMTLTSGLVLQLHRDLFKYTALPGGAWKSVDNTITEKHPDGTEIIRFEPVPAFQTPF